MEEIINRLLFAKNPELWEPYKNICLKNIERYTKQKEFIIMLLKNNLSFFNDSLNNLPIKVDEMREYHIYHKIKEMEKSIYVDLITEISFHFGFIDNIGNIIINIEYNKTRKIKNKKQIINKLYEALFCCGAEIGSNMKFITETEVFMDILRNDQNKLIIGNVIPQLTDELLTDLFIQIIEKKGEYYSILFNVFEHLRKKIQMSSLNSHLPVNDQRVYQYIRSLNASLNEITDGAFRKMKSEYTKYHYHIDRT